MDDPDTMSSRKRSAVTPATRAQLARLFGEASQEASREEMTSSQWRSVLRKVLDHLHSYLRANVPTDDIHSLMLCTGLASARKSLDQDDDFWPGFAEGMTRLALLLMGDYPDHRKNRPGSRKKNHFELRRLRTLRYTQDATQKLECLIAAYQFGLPKFRGDPLLALDEFRMQHGSEASYDDFIAWYKINYPENYVLVF